MGSRTQEVRDTWSFPGERPAQRFVLRWTEHGVQRPGPTAFGHTAIQGGVEHALNADVQLNYVQAGLEWRVNASTTAVTPAAR
jgi:hypothetical protein